MNKRLFLCAELAAGAGVGGLAVGASEALYRDAGWLYGAFLYGALWSVAGLAGTVALCPLWRARRTLLGAGLFTWGLVASLSLSALVLVRFIVARDVLNEVAEEMWKATGSGLLAAAAIALGVLALGRGLGPLFSGKRHPPPIGPAWLWPVAIIALFAVQTLGGADNHPDTPAARPLRGKGVILVLVDTLRADVLGAYGAEPHNGKPMSPNIDALAKRGLLFSDVSAQASWTKPAVASIMTSRHVAGHGTMAKSAILPPALPTIATAAQRAGIKTAAVVTNYNLEAGFGFAQGFDEFHYLGPDRYLGAPERANRLAAYNVLRLLREKFFTNMRQARHFYQSGDLVNSYAFDILDRVGDDNFFLWLHYMEPHDPYFANDGRSFAKVSSPHPPASAARDMRLAYQDDVQRLDAKIGALLAGLEARGLRDSVNIVLIGDHGEEFYDHGGYYHGVTLYEEQLHVPLILTGPGIEPAVRGDVARQIDAAPSMAAMLGVALPLSWEGRELVASQEAPSVTIAEESHEGNVLTAVRDVASGEKLISANANNPRGLQLRELYAIGSDPHEKQLLTDQSAYDKLQLAFEQAQRRAAAGGARAASRTLDNEAQAELRSLGYVQ